MVPPTLYHFFDIGVSRSHRTLLTLCIFSLLPRHLPVFSSSHRLLSSGPTVRVCLCDTASHNLSCPYNHLTDHIAITSVGSPFSHRRRFTSALGTYPEKPTISFSLTHKSPGTPPFRSPQPYLSPPVLNPNNAVLSGRSTSPPSWLSSKRFFCGLAP